jgi:hypothetical protein
VNWSHEKQLKDERELKEVESQLDGLYFQDLIGYTSEDHRTLISGLEKRKNRIGGKRGRLETWKRSSWVMRIPNFFIILQTIEKCEHDMEKEKTGWIFGFKFQGSS